MNDNQLEVIAWWFNRRDYITGLSLLSRFGKNKMLTHTLSKKGKDRFSANIKKLHYELIKSVGLDYRNMPLDPLPDETEEEETDITGHQLPSTEPPAGEPEDFQSEKSNFKADDLNQLPRIIRRLKYEYGELFQKRSQDHASINLIDSANTEENNKQRSGVLALVKAASNRLAILYEFIEAYEATGVVPEEDKVWPPQIKEKTKAPLTLDQLRKQQKQLQKSNTISSNLLNFRQRNTGSEPNPMPPGAKRSEMEAKIALRKENIDELARLISELENAS